ncbi:MAG: hypothetical protein ACPGYT_11870 [Nitrospirales bacterium]
MFNVKECVSEETVLQNKDGRECVFLMETKQGEIVARFPDKNIICPLCFLKEWSIKEQGLDRSKLVTGETVMTDMYGSLVFLEWFGELMHVARLPSTQPREGFGMHTQVFRKADWKKLKIIEDEI